MERARTGSGNDVSSVGGSSVRSQVRRAIENLAISLLKLTAFIVATSVRVMESRPSWCGP
jgi:hypothetical protein